MKTMLWKELRENLKWAALALAAMVAAEFYALFRGRSDYGGSLTLCDPAFLMVTSFGCATVGAALGVLQFLPELRRDQWAALLHRPVSRSVIFFGKVLAGLLLCLAATVLPFVASVVFAAVPGQFAVPLVPGMALPGSSDLLLGPLFYFAAVLLCLHRGRWFGSRGLAALSVVPVFALHIMSGWIFLAPLLASVALLLAAWGAMRSRESMSGRPWPGRAAFLLALVTGAATAWLLLGEGLEFVTTRNAPVDFDYAQFEVTRDGQILLASQHGDATSVTNLNGKPVTDERYVGNNSYGNLCQMLPLVYLNFRYQSEAYLRREPRNLRNYVQEIDENSGAKETWFRLMRENYFIGFDNLSRRCAGIFDAEGFKPPGSVPKPFYARVQPSEYARSTPYYFWAGPQVYALDPLERTMTPVFNAQNDGILSLLPMRGEPTDPKPSVLAIGMKDSFLLVKPSGGVTGPIPYPHDTASWPNIWITTNLKLNRTYVQSSQAFYPAGPQGARADSVEFLDELDAQGRILHAYNRSSPAYFAAERSWVQRLFAGAVPPLPAFADWLYSRAFPSDADEVFPDTFSVGIPLPRDLAVASAVGLLLGGIAFAWARGAGYTRGRAARWALFILCFGLPGLAAFRLGSDWPACIRCPRCGRKRPIEKERCPHCHEPWPAPERTGAEIIQLEKAGA